MTISQFTLTPLVKASHKTSFGNPIPTSLNTQIKPSKSSTHKARASSKSLLPRSALCPHLHWALLRRIPSIHPNRRMTSNSRAFKTLAAHNEDTYLGLQPTQTPHFHFRLHFGTERFVPPSPCSFFSFPPFTGTCQIHTLKSVVSCLFSIFLLLLILPVPQG